MTAGGLRVEIAEELVFPRFKRTDIHRDLLAAGDYLLAPQLSAFEFLGRRIVVLDGQGYFLAGRDLDFSRLELVVLDHQRVGGILRGRAGYYCQHEGERERGGPRHTRLSGKLEDRRMRLSRSSTPFRSPA